MKIGETILKLREEKKMSQEEFAQYYHVTRQTISNWEKEKNYPDLQTLVKISDESGVPLDSMLKDNFSMVQEIDKKVRHLKIFKIGTIVVLAIVILVSAYIGIQNGKQDHLVRTYEDKLEELGFEQEGNNYCLTDSDFKYDIYMFDRPSIWKWNQEMSDREKFIVATLLVKNSDLEENPGDYFVGSYSTIFMSRNRKKMWNQPSFTIQASGRQAPIHPGGEPMVKVGKDKYIFSDGEENNRRLSVKEIARIQTFPDWYEFSRGTSNRNANSKLDLVYKQIGNAVPVRLALAVAEPIAEFAKEQLEKKEKIEIKKIMNMKNNIKRVG